MKHLYLLRHAKSDWHAGSSSDHERPLNGRGVEAAAAVGRFLTSLGQQPDLVVSSSAVRARSTAELAKVAGRWEAEIQIAPELYGAVPTDLLTILRQQPDSISRLLLVGHQPTWSQAVGRFVGNADVKMVPAALARIDLGSETWADAEFGSGVLSWLVTPKLLAAAPAAE